MQITNRLKKLENKSNVNGEFCVCTGSSQPLYTVTYADNGVRREPDVTDAETCELCGRAVNQTLIVVNFVKPKKPAWMTDKQYADVLAANGRKAR